MAELLEFLIPILIIIGIVIVNSVKEAMEQAQRGRSGPAPDASPRQRPKKQKTSEYGETDLDRRMQERRTQRARDASPNEFEQLPDGTIVVYNDANQHIFLERQVCRNCDHEGLLSFQQRTPRRGLSEVKAECPICGTQRTVIFNVQNPAYRDYVMTTGRTEHDVHLKPRRRLLKEQRANRKRKKARKRRKAARKKLEQAGSRRTVPRRTLPTSSRTTEGVLNLSEIEGRPLLQQAFLYKEIFDRPVSLRDRGRSGP